MRAHTRGTAHMPPSCEHTTAACVGPADVMLPGAPLCVCVCVISPGPCYLLSHKHCHARARHDPPSSPSQLWEVTGVFPDICSGTVRADVRSASGRGRGAAGGPPTAPAGQAASVQLQTLTSSAHRSLCAQTNCAMCLCKNAPDFLEWLYKKFIFT